ncbi:Fidgetin-like protein 1 [Frankliniella fusca]|uniref:Fidgetin-like protein 1 n=1 Tax=Frankliniella fusca TaxID=407009 RepID=A0AAE1HC16_9NEOP|nr:Fidgetin-like protein 1 [Frankliniella fusca]
MSGRPGSYRGHGPELPDRRFDGRHSRQPSFPRERDRDRDYGDHYRNQHQHSYRGSSSSRARRSPSPDRDRHYDDLYRHQHHYSYRSSSSSRARRSPSPRYRASSTFRPDYDSFQRREPYHEYREYRGGSRAPHDGPEPDRRDNRYERHRHSSSSQPSHPLSRSHDGDYYRGPSSSTARHSRTRSRSPCSRSSTDAPPPRDSTRQAPEALSKAPTPMPEAIAPNWREKAIVTEEAGKIAAASLADVKAHISANILSTRLRSQRGTPEHLSPMETIVLDDESIADSDKDDGDFIPNPTSKPKKQSRVNSLSLSDNQGKKGRGKGVKNKKPSKQKILDELSKSRAEIEALRTADNKVEFPDSKLNAKPTSPFSFGTKSFDNVPSSHPFIGEDLKFEMIGSAIEDRFIDQIYDGCLLAKCDTEWSDIGGLEEVKKSLKEVVIDPLRRPDIFTGLRAAPKGVLLYGPPGTGKTLIARCIASQCQSSFFNVSASKLTSKWVGDGEKNVQALFAVARTMQPSVIFIDEVDSVLSKRTEKENDASKKMKTEFLVQMSLLQWITPSFQLCTTMLGSKPAVEVKLKYECEVCHRVFTDHYNAVGHICFDHLGYSKIPKSYTGRDTNCPFCHRVLHHSSYLMKHLGYHARKLHVVCKEAIKK